jgi:hypothetical protein
MNRFGTNIQTFFVICRVAGLNLRISYCVGPCQLLAENRAQVVSTQRLVAEGLGGILEKVARMQDNLQALAI